MSVRCVVQAHSQLLDPANYAGLESGLTWLGVAGLIDPPRPEVKGAIEDCMRAGIRVRPSRILFLSLQSWMGCLATGIICNALNSVEELCAGPSCSSILLRAALEPCACF